MRQSPQRITYNSNTTAANRGAGWRGLRGWCCFIPVTARQESLPYTLSRHNQKEGEVFSRQGIKESRTTGTVETLVRTTLLFASIIQDRELSVDENRVWQFILPVSTINGQKKSNEQRRKNGAVNYFPLAVTPSCPAGDQRVFQQARGSCCRFKNLGTATIKLRFPTATGKTISMQPVPAQGSLFALGCSTQDLFCNTQVHVNPS